MKMKNEESNDILSRLNEVQNDSPLALNIQPLSGLGNYVIALYFTQSGNAII